MNIQLAGYDRKFMWLSDPSNPYSEFVVYRFKSILFGSVSSPFILNSVVKSHLEQKPTAVTKDLAMKTEFNKKYSQSNYEINNIELHVFADASMKAYDTVVYLKHGKNISFVISNPG